MRSTARTGLLVLLGVILVFFGTPAGALDPQKAVVSKPGNVIVDTKARRAELRGFGRDALRRICEGELFRPGIRLVPILDPGVVVDLGLDIRMAAFAFVIMEASGEYLALSSPRSTDVVAGNLGAWAKAGAMRRWEDRHPNTYVSVDRALLPAIAGFAVVRPGMAVAERRRVRLWLGNLMVLHDGPRNCTSCAVDGDRSLREAVNMAWGALTGDNARFRSGIAWYQAAIRRIAPDGRLPVASRRGALALWSTNRAISALVTLAEMAAVQGYDLYAERADGADLHRAIDFFLDGLERIGPGGRIKPGTLKQAFPRLHQRAGFLYPRGSGRHAMAWVEAYLARFPGNPNARRIRGMFKAKKIIAREMMIHELAGGNATCLFGGPNPL